ncbi:MAG: hypothetical protein JWM12_1440, partial [Ilumatobacteraceae bacterium]|nr:hypothetical protein [Ilumatobacteraceae bacterium]
RRMSVAASVSALVVLAGVGGWLLWGTSSSAEGVVTRGSSATTIAIATSTTVGSTTPRTTTHAVEATSTAAPATAPATIAPRTTAPSPTVAPPTLAPPTLAPPTTVLGPFGDVVGQPVAEPATPQAATAAALQARQPASSVADADTPAWFYAEWLNLGGRTPATPATVSADGYHIDADGPADLSAFVLGDNGKVSSFTECTSECADLATAIQISPNCVPGPDCAAFASNDGQMIAVLRATVNVRSPITTLLFSVSATQPVIAVTDPNSTVRYDGVERFFSITLPAGPPPGTESVVTVTFLDGSTSKLTITYG